MSAGWTDSVAKFISSPPAQFIAGGVLARLVWQAFKSVENVLNDDAKRQVAAWLSGVRVKPKVDRWYDQYLDAISGLADWDVESEELGLIWPFFLGLIFVVMGTVLLIRRNNPVFYAAAGEVINNPYRYIGGDVLLPMFRVMLLLPGFALASVMSVFVSAGFLFAMSRTNLFWLRILILAGQVLVSLYLGLASAALGLALTSHVHLWSSYDWIVGPNSSYGSVFGSGLSMWLHPLTLLARIWNTGSLAAFVAPTLGPTFGLLLFTISGLILIAVQRFDLGFSWFVRWFDIEEKPLQSVGLVAGAVVALAYWGVIIAVRW